MAQEAKTRIVEVYMTADGRKPFWEWLEGIKDKRTGIRLSRYIDRIESGNLGDHKGVGEGVLEMRLFFGPGYRIYFAEHGDTIVVLLCGGDKSTQDKDIETAKTYWADYKEKNQ